MSKATTDVLLWAQRIVARRDAAPHELLEVARGAPFEDVQNAFHKIAKMAHPDMHRTTLNAEELERVTWAYATVAAAYQALRVASRGGPTPMAPEMVRTPPPEPRVRRASAGSGGVVLPGGAVIGSRSGHASRPAHDAHGPQVAPTRGSAPVIPTAAAQAPAPSGDGLPPANPIVDAPTHPPRGAMSSKALVYFRKAEFALKSGDLRTALLNLRLAIAADPASTLLRNALAEVDAEMKSAGPPK